METAKESGKKIPENSTAVPEKEISFPQKDSKSTFQKAYKTFDLPNGDSSFGIKEFLLLKKEETTIIFHNKLETCKSMKVGKWLHCIDSKKTDTRGGIKNAEFKTPNNEVFQETDLVSIYNSMSEKIVKESEDFEDKDSG
ncbi:hypothetical protein NPIL_174701 [Nephila pilipes]|uniref:Uncharacterized protein n=1 Tax=Nephila pilipes TaxID=299642 RepID=A0A8X6NBA6_NEPPI|nr:hypothetical protein NPIL_174701 [Nephila pilipes]